MKHLNFIFLFLFLSTFCNAQKLNTYDVKNIPDSLLKNSNVVIRIEINHYKYNNIKNISYQYKLVKTILNEKGQGQASHSHRYDDYLLISDIEGTLYDSKGKKVKSLKNKDIKDYSAYDGFSIATDARYKQIDFNYAVYPYTVEFIIDQIILTTHHNLFDSYQTEINTSIQNFTTTYDLPSDLNFDFFKINSIKNEVKETITQKGSRKNISLVIENLISQKLEILQNRKTPLIIGRFNEFAYAQYKGSKQTWKDYGNFILQLNEGRSTLPIEEKNKVKEIVQNLNSDKEKVEAIYKYMQSKTRYVSIQFGIGGQQPYPAEEVSKLGYGDCKALSNYMCALLEEVGIKSNYVLIYAGKDNFNFPYNDISTNFFNHAILLVPMKNDSIWLECTSQTSSFGYMGSFTGNRYALVIEKDNSRIIRTESYDKKNNVSIRNASAIILPDGTLSIDYSTKYKCMSGDEIDYVYNNYSSDDLKKYLNSRFNIPSYNINEYNYYRTGAKEPIVNETMKVVLPYYASISGNRIFLLPNIFNKKDDKLTTDTLRKSDFYCDYDLTEIDSITIGIPEGYKIESTPKKFSTNNEFGSYQINIEKTDSKVIYIRKRTISKGDYNKSKFNDFVIYNNIIYNTDRNKLVFVKK
jgi:hypothetical protein